MSAIIQQLDNSAGDSVYPVTKTSAVYDNNNNRLDNTLTALSDSLSYNTTETVCGKWINNKPIYRRVINTVTKENDRDLIISDLVGVVDKVIVLNGMITSDDWEIPVPSVQISGNVRYITFNKNSGIMYRKIEGVTENLPLDIIMEYTKTSD